MGLADADRTRAVLTAAGWSDVAMTAVDDWCVLGLDGHDGVEDRLTMALNSIVGSALRDALKPELDPAGWEAALEEARAELRTDSENGVVRFLGHTWLVTASNPG